MIRLRGVNKRYGKFHAVRSLDLEIQKGELFGFRISSLHDRAHSA